MNSQIFITKDAFYRGYMPLYGNNYWQTPNIDELAKKGTAFYKHFTAAPSTIMSNMCMFTGLYPHESELSQYVHSGLHFKGDSFWTKAESLGYRCHIIWDEAWVSVFKVFERYYCYGENTVIHNLNGFRQGVGAHYIHEGGLTNDDSKTNKVFDMIRGELSKIFEQNNEPVFIWMHVPHVINGRSGYGTDIDVYDSIVGIVREFFDDNSITISADHGNMNGFKGKIGYGHDVYNPAALIPLITPKIDELEACNELTTNIDISSIIFDRKIVHRDLIYCDSAFYAQPNRKLAIITNTHKYIYNKANKKEELYDLRTDPHEDCNLISDSIYDVDRHIESPLRELYFYPYWDQLPEIREFMRNEKNKIWKEGSFTEEAIPRLKFYIQSHGYHKLHRNIHRFKEKMKL